MEIRQKRNFFLSLLAGLIPVVILTTTALTQLGEYSYTRLGGIVIYIQAGYVFLLLLATIVAFILRKKDIAPGLLVSFIIGFFVSLLTFGMGL